MEPEQYNVSVERAEAVAVFQPHQPFSITEARKAVTKSGFSYERIEIVARGQLNRVDSRGEPTHLLHDSKAKMTLLLTASDTEDVYERLLAATQQEPIDRVHQVHGRLSDTEKAQRRAREMGADFVITLTSLEDAETATIPPLRPPRKSEMEGEKNRDGWF